jgi:MoxR-like ATPase
LFDKEKRVSLLNDHQAFRSFIDKIRQDKNFALRNIILHLLYPDEYERSSSYSNKLKMYKAFKNRTPELVLPEDVDDALLLIRNHYENKYPGQELDFYEKPLSQYWKIEDIYLKTAFQNWMRNQKKSNGEQYKEGTVTAYTNALKNATSKLNLGDAVQTDLFCYSSFETFEEVHQIIINAPNFEKVDLAAGNKDYSNGMVLYAKFLKEMDEPACWIFQGDSKYCDVIEAVNELDEMMWAVNQYTKQIKSGDKVYIWLSGTGGGIIAAGIIMNDPELRDPDLDDPCNSGETLKLEPLLAVDIKLERKLTTGIVSGTILLADERTKHLDILTHPGATNFPVSKEQDAVIESIINGTYVRIPATYAIPTSATDKKRYWMYAPGEGSKMWEEFHQNSIMGIEWDELGDLTKYPTKEAMKEKMKELYGEDYSYKNAGHATWQFANELKIGDIVFVKKGLKKIVGRGVVTSEYRFDGARSEYRHIHSVNWTHKGEWDHDGQIVLKTLTDITPYTDYYKRLEDMFAAATDGDLLPDDKTAQYESYTQEDFLSEVYLSEERYNTLKNLLLKKKNLILQGAPGVGKTYAAERLAFSIMGKKDSSRVRIVQFHQSYSYEDFVMGYRPDENGFKLARGPFYTFCKDAEPDDREYFFIIDEINRGNLSKILGELLMLIENDKRGKEVRLLYSDEQFSVPENVYIIGMMNTADRSLAMIDYALRRRFAFFEFDPAFETEGFKSHQASIANRKFDNLVEAVAAMNRAIAEDASLGSGFQVGHSYFCTCDIVGDDWLSDLVKYELLPLIKEYWFDEPSKVEQWNQRLHGAIHD